MQTRAVRSRLRVMEAALETFDDVGYDAATWKRIAERAHVSEGLVCRYFPTKEALAIAVYERTAGQLEEWVGSLPNGTMAERFTATVRAKLAILEPQRRAIGALVARTLQPDDPANPLGPAAAQARARFIAVFAAAVHGASDAPSHDEADALARMMYAAHLLILIVWLQEREPARPVTAAALDVAAMAINANLAGMLSTRAGTRIDGLLQLQTAPAQKVDRFLDVLRRHGPDVVPLSSAAHAFHRAQLGQVLAAGGPVTVVVSLEPEGAPVDGIRQLVQDLREVHAAGVELVLADGGLVVAEPMGLPAAQLRRHRAALDGMDARVWGLEDAFEPAGSVPRHARLLAHYGRNDDGPELARRRKAWLRLLRAAFPGSVLVSTLPQPDLSPWLEIRAREQA